MKSRVRSVGNLGLEVFFTLGFITVLVTDAANQVGPYGFAAIAAFNLCIFVHENGKPWSADS